MNANMYAFVHPKLVREELDEAGFLTIVTLILDQHHLDFDRDCVVEDHTISIEADISKAEERVIAQEIADIVEG